MVIGLSTFQRFFEDYTDNYILIGGSACDINLAQQELAFRATRDLDIVLCIETRDAQFINTFRDFIRAGKYAIGEKSTGKKQFYRFKDPATPDFPYMLELFSRRPDVLKISDDSLLTPIPADDETSSLSAILLNDDYYEFIHDNRSIIDGLSVVLPGTSSFVTSTFSTGENNGHLQSSGMGAIGAQLRIADVSSNSCGRLSSRSVLRLRDSVPLSRHLCKKLCHLGFSLELMPVQFRPVHEVSQPGRFPGIAASR